MERVVCQPRQARLWQSEQRHTSNVGQRLAGEVFVNGLLDLLFTVEASALEDMTQDHLGLALPLYVLRVLSVLAVVLVELLEQSSAEIVADREGRHAGRGKEAKCRGQAKRDERRATG